MIKVDSTSMSVFAHNTIGLVEKTEIKESVPWTTGDYNYQWSPIKKEDVHCYKLQFAHEKTKVREYIETSKCLVNYKMIREVLAICNQKKLNKKFRFFQRDAEEEPLAIVNETGDLFLLAGLIEKDVLEEVRIEFSPRIFA